ncbi:hypothetical protein ACET3Z_014412 [Daucus carota]
MLRIQPMTNMLNVYRFTMLAAEVRNIGFELVKSNTNIELAGCGLAHLGLGQQIEAQIIPFFPRFSYSTPSTGAAGASPPLLTKVHEEVIIAKAHVEDGTGQQV